MDLTDCDKARPLWISVPVLSVRETCNEIKRLSEEFFTAWCEYKRNVENIRHLVLLKLRKFMRHIWKPGGKKVQPDIRASNAFVFSAYLVRAERMNFVTISQIHLANTVLYVCLTKGHNHRKIPHLSKHFMENFIFQLSWGLWERSATELLSWHRMLCIALANQIQHWQAIITEALTTIWAKVIWPCFARWC